MAVKLREKKLANGQVSFYLDIYHNQRRWYEFLNIRISRKKSTEEDKEKRKLAGEIRTKTATLYQLRQFVGTRLVEK
jgi:hypothetical protein